MAKELAVVCGGGGFIGGHLVADLLRAGRARHASRRRQAVRASGTSASTTSTTCVLDLRGRRLPREAAVEGATIVYNLAADMGGMGFIENNKALCMLSRADQHAPADGGEATPASPRFFYASSACVYAADKQTSPDVTPLARGATPIRRCPRTATAGRSSSASGCAGTSARTSASRRGSRATTTSTARTARTTAAARRRRPRSAARSPRRSCRGEHEIEIWGDGEQTRSFMYIDDCVEGIERMMAQRRRRADQPRQQRDGHDQPARRHRRGHRRHQAEAPLQPAAPKGVRGRNSDNTLIKKLLGWEPSTSLRGRPGGRPTAGSARRWTASGSPRPSPPDDPDRRAQRRGDHRAGRRVVSRRDGRADHPDRRSLDRRHRGPRHRCWPARACAWSRCSAPASRLGGPADRARTP